MRLALRLLIALAAGVATYLLLLLAVLLAVGGAVSCTNSCTDTAEFLNDAYPWPMIVGIGVSVGSAAWTLRRLRS